MFSQGENIFRSLSQRRDAELELAQAMKQIFAETAFAHC
jgi:hypothetical protein